MDLNKVTSSYSFCPSSSACGHGTCGNQTWYCDCEPGYRYDTVHTLYFNCFMSDATWVAYFATNVCFGLIALVFWCIVYPKTKRTGRRLIKCVGLGLVFYLCYFVSLFVTGYVGPAAASFTALYIIVCIFGQCLLLLKMVVEPVYTMAKTQTLWKFVLVARILFVFFSVLVIVCITCGQVLLSQGNVVVYNHANNMVLFIIVGFGLGLFFFLNWQMRTLYWLVVQHTQQHDSMSVQMENLKHRIHVMRVTSFFISLVCISLLVGIAVAHYALNIHAYRFAIFWVLNLAIPAWGMSILYFLRTRSTKELEESKSSRLNVSKV